MSHESHFEVNVAKATGTRWDSHKGSVATFTHHFKADVGTDQQRAVARAQDIAARFPAPEFKVELTYWESRGHDIALSPS